MRSAREASTPMQAACRNGASIPAPGAGWAMPRLPGAGSGLWVGLRCEALRGRSFPWRWCTWHLLKSRTVVGKVLSTGRAPVQPACLARRGPVWRKAADLRFGSRVLARPPSRDTLQIGPCQLRGGIHAATGPATVGGQGPVEMVGVSVQATGDVRSLCQQTLAARISPSVTPHRLRTMRRFDRTADQCSGAVASPLAGPLAAWMLPSSPQGRVNGVSRER